MVLEYCLPTKSCEIVKLSYYKNYRKILGMLDNDNWFSAIYWTCRNGHMELVIRFVSLINSTECYEYSRYFRWGLRGACHGGHMKIVLYLLKNYIYYNNVLDWNWGLWGACEGGQIKIVAFMIDNNMVKYDKNTLHHIDDGILIARCGEYEDIVKLLMKYKAD